MTLEDEQIAEQDKLRAFRERQRRDDFLAIMRTAGGRRFVWDLMSRTNIFGSIYNPDHSAMALIEGKRQVGLEVLTDCNELCPELYLMMMKEANKPIDQPKERDR